MKLCFSLEELKKPASEDVKKRLKRECEADEILSRHLANSREKANRANNVTCNKETTQYFYLRASAEKLALENERTVP